MEECRYDPVGECIYCGSKVYAKDSKRYLAEEHIIPYGLNGRLVLPRASCRACERVTGRHESRLLRGALLGCRSVLNLRTRSPSEKPKSLPIFDPRSTPNRKIMVDVGDYPIHLLLLYLDTPALLRDHPERPARIFSHFFRQIDHLRIKQIYGLEEFALSALDMGVLVTVIAKIAHSFAVAELGLKAFKPFLIEQILAGLKDASSSDFIGGSLDKMPISDELHQVGFEEHPRLVIVGLRLFANLGAPYYRIVVGERL